MENNIRIEGWLIYTKDIVKHTTHIYDEQWNPTDEEEHHESDAHVLGIRTESGEEIIFAQYIEDVLNQVQDYCYENKVPASIRYHVTDTQKSFEELNTDWLMNVEGYPTSASYYHRCSDLSGYLYTTEKFIVNEHDIVQELYNHIGGPNGYYTDNIPNRWLSMEIKIGYI